MVLVYISIWDSYWKKLTAWNAHTKEIQSFQCSSSRHFISLLIYFVAFILRQPSVKIVLNQNIAPWIWTSVFRFKQYNILIFGIDCLHCHCYEQRIFFLSGFLGNSMYVRIETWDNGITFFNKLKFTNFAGVPGWWYGSTFSGINFRIFFYFQILWGVIHNRSPSLGVLLHKKPNEFRRGERNMSVHFRKCVFIKSHLSRQFLYFVVCTVYTFHRQNLKLTEWKQSARKKRENKLFWNSNFYRKEREVIKVGHMEQLKVTTWVKKVKLFNSERK